LDFGGNQNILSKQNNSNLINLNCLIQTKKFEK